MADIATGCLLAALSVLLHLGMSSLLMKWTGGAWMGLFFAGWLIRFAIVTGVIVLVLRATEIDPLRFTLSFILSYIFWSVTEAFWIHRRRRRRTESSHAR